MQKCLKQHGTSLLPTQLPRKARRVLKKHPEQLTYGFNTVNGEEIFFIPNPALGLWINRETFKE